MKLMYRNIDKDGNGHLALIPDEAEDMWHLYNIIFKGDRIRATTIRKVQQESATGSSSSSRVRTMVTLEVETLDFDAIYCVLRIKGRNVQENKFIKMGGYHTIDIETNRKLTLHKEEWDSISLEMIENACDPSKHADLAAIIMQEGLGTLYIVTSARTVEKCKIDNHIPKKGKYDDSNRKKAIDKFYELLLSAVVRHLNFDVIKAVVVASPGFYKDQFYEYLSKEALNGDKLLSENKSKFLLVHCNGAFKGSLREVLENPVVMTKLADTKALAETKALQQFTTTLYSAPDRAFYGFAHVQQANEAQAIETLLVSDSLFRSSNISERKKYVSLVESVRENSGEVKIFSSLHISGEQLNRMTGVAAILRFPMPEIEEENNSDSNSD